VEERRKEGEGRESGGTVWSKEIKPSLGVTETPGPKGVSSKNQRD
jgi:hypothetical protein